MKYWLHLVRYEKDVDISHVILSIYSRIIHENVMFIVKNLAVWAGCLIRNPQNVNAAL